MRIHKKLKHLFKGFTLVELIVVISVLAVLASIAMSQVSNITAWARDSQRMTDMSAMKSSIELYKAKTGKLPIPTNGSWVVYSGALLWTQGTFGEPTWRQLNSITPKPVDPTNAIEYVYSVANNNREFELGGILEKATWYFPNILPQLLAASQNVTFIEGTYNGVSLKVETGSKTYVVAAPSLIGGYLGDAKMENTGLTIEWLGSLPKGFSGVVVSTAQTGTFTPVIAWSGSKLPDTSTGAEAMIIGLQSAYSGTIATSLSQISSLVSATWTQITALGEGLVENALGGDISGQSSGGGSTVVWALNCASPTVTTIAGAYPTRTNDYLNGTWTAARFWWPSGITVDTTGNLYVADTSNHAIRKITPAWAVTTIAGAYPTKASGYLDGLWTAARFNSPSGITVDTTGNLYVADTSNHAIRKITPAWAVTTIAGAYPTPVAEILNATGTAARFFAPKGITVDNIGNVYVVDGMGHAIRKITPAGVVTTIAGPYPTLTSGFLNGQGTSAQFNGAIGITVDATGNLYVADTYNHAIRKITPDGTVTTIVGAYPTRATGFVDGTGTSAKFNWPSGVKIDSVGNLYVVDTQNYAIRKITPAGVVTTISGSYPTVSYGFANWIGTAARFYDPNWVTIDSSGNLYVADTLNHAIRKISCQ